MTTPRLVLVHGTRFSHSQWVTYAGAFPEIDVVAPDLPGHGRRMGEPFSTEAAIAAIGEGVEDGPAGAPVVLAGHSLGGYMAMAYAARHPDRLAGLVLIGAAAVPRGVGAAAYRAFARLIDAVGAERAGRAADAVMSHMSDRKTLEAITEGGMSYEATEAAWNAVITECRPEMLADVTCPVLFLAGQFDQLRVDTDRFVEASRDARAEVVPRATHMLPITHPDIVARILGDFVAEVATDDSEPTAST